MYRVIVAGEDGSGKRSLLDAISTTRFGDALAGVRVRHWSCVYDRRRPCVDLELLELPSDPALCPPLIAMTARTAALMLVYDSNDSGAFDRLARRWASVLSLRSEVPSFRVLVATKHGCDDAKILSSIESESVAHHWRVYAHCAVLAQEDPRSVRRLFAWLCKSLVALPALPRIDAESRRWMMD